MTTARVFQPQFFLDKNSKTSLQQQISEQIIKFIEKGILQPGEGLLSIRDFSENYQISRNTVTFAFEKLSAEGWIETRPGALARVSSYLTIPRTLPTASGFSGLGSAGNRLIEPIRTAEPCSALSLPLQDKEIDFRLNAIPIKIVSRILSNNHSTLAHATALCSCQRPEGSVELRTAIAHHIAISKGIQASAQQIIIVNGTQEALAIIGFLFCNEGRDILIENPCYRGAYNLFSAMKGNIHFRGVDEEGMICADMPSWEALVYITPSHQFPLGMMMGEKRRLELAAWARNTGSLIIEDDYDGDFFYENSSRHTLASLAPAHTLHLGSFSKTLGPGIRLGFIVCPPRLVQDMVSAKSILSASTSALGQRIATDLLTTNAFAAHLRRLRRHCMTLRDMLVKILSDFGGSISGQHGAMHICWTLPDTAPSAQFIQRTLRQRGIRIYVTADIAFIQAASGMDRQLFIGYGAASLDDIYTLHAALRWILKKDSQAEPQLWASEANALCNALGSPSALA